MQKSDPTQTASSFPQPLDRIAIALMLVLSVLIGLLLWNGDRTAPRVRSFNWQDKHVGAQDTAFVITFSRPMDHTSVEANLKIEPPLPGKVSWAGRRMAYTLTTPAPYGTTYELQLQSAYDLFSRRSTENPENKDAKPRVVADARPIQPFLGQFKTRDRAFAYIGVEAGEEGRLVLYNLTQQKKQVLTPPDLVVMDFKPYPNSDRILFSATDTASQKQGKLNQQIYTVTTGIHLIPPGESVSEAKSAGQIEQVLDSKTHQNLKFDLSNDGKTIVVQRVNQKNPADFGLWIIREGAEPQPLGNQPGGDFLITPDSASLAFAQGQGLAILPLQPQAEPLDFLPKFGTVLSFAPNGSAAAMVKFNTDYTRSLFLINNQGTQKELLKTTGSILSAQFDPTQQRLYCLLTELIPGSEYQERPYLVSVDLKTAEQQPLLKLPIGQRDIQMSLSPDGLAFLFDQTLVAKDDEDNATSLRNDEGKAIAASRLWLLPLAFSGEAEEALIPPEPLPLSGFHPRWLP